MLRQEMNIGYFNYIHRPGEKLGVFDNGGFIDSRIGGRKENQDSAGLKETKLGYLVVVCDGMGGNINKKLRRKENEN